MGTCTTGSGLACPAFPGAAGPSGTEAQEERGRVLYSRHRDRGDPLHVCRICVREALEQVCSMEATGKAEQREWVQGMGGGYGPVVASWWGVVFPKDKLQRE